jgi:hypothetical protein
MSAPMAQAARPPQISVSKSALFARTNVSWLTKCKCVMAVTIGASCPRSHNARWCVTLRGYCGKAGLRLTRPC